MKRTQIILAIIFGVSISSFVFAGTIHNMSGWAWAENIGWISFNNLTGGGSIDYGVKVDAVTNILSGYAWSENIGWISFNTNDLIGCPVVPCEAVYSSATKKFSGWARALAPRGKTQSKTGGWNGWIKLNGIQYQPIVLSGQNPKPIKGWVWGGGETSKDATIGWISFNCLNNGQCATSNYGLKINLLTAPVTPDFDENYINVIKCPNYQVQFAWIYKDSEGDNQAGYWIQADDDPDFSSPDLDYQGEQIISCPSIPCEVRTNSRFFKVSSDLISGEPFLNFNKTYHWRLKIKNENLLWSDWKPAVDFSTPLHQYPSVDFSYSPENLIMNEPVFFTSSPIFYDTICSTDQSDGKCLYTWQFLNGVPNISHNFNEEVIFENTGAKNISLTVTDSDGYSCSEEKIINLSRSRNAPKWQELVPFD